MHSSPAGRLVRFQRQKPTVRTVRRGHAVFDPRSARLPETSRRVRRAATRRIHDRLESRRTVTAQHEHRARGPVGSETRTVRIENRMETRNYLLLLLFGADLYLLIGCTKS